MNRTMVHHHALRYRDHTATLGAEARAQIDGRHIEVVERGESACRFIGAPVDEQANRRPCKDLDRPLARIRRASRLPGPDGGDAIGGGDQVEAELTNSQIVSGRMPKGPLRMQEQRYGGDYVATHGRGQAVEPALFDGLTGRCKKAQQLATSGRRTTGGRRGRGLRCWRHDDAVTSDRSFPKRAVGYDHHLVVVVMPGDGRPD